MLVTLGEAIKLARAREGMTLRDLAQRASVSKSFLSDIENNKSKPAVDTLTRIATALKVRVSELLGEDQDDTAIDPTLRSILHNPNLIEAARHPAVRALLASPEVGVYLRAAIALEQLDTESLIAIAEVREDAKRRLAAKRKERERLDRFKE